MQALKLLGQQLSKIWHQLGVNQKVVIVVSGLAVVAGLSALIFWSSRPNYGLLFGRLAPDEAGKIIAELEEMKIPFKIGQNGASVLVPQDKVHFSRMQLATKGMPKSDGVGFEIFDKPTFGMSDFVQNANYNRALEGELSRTITQINGVESARVMISKPESRLLVDPQKKAKASVLVKLRGVAHLEGNAVNAIRFLVASAVDGLKPTDVSVVDNSGNVLSENSEEGSLASLSSTQLAARRNYENYLRDKVKAMLEKVLGPDQAVVTISAEINTESLTKSDEVYDPKQMTPRTVMTKDESVESNTPNAAGFPGTPTNSSTETNSPAFTNTSNKTTKKDQTTDYAVSISKTNIVRVAGDPKRITAAVFVNTSTNPTINTNMLKEAVYNALGLQPNAQDSGIGEVVTVYGYAFNKEHEDKMSTQMEKEKRTEFYMKSGKSGLYALLAVAALFGFWRLVRNSTEELLPTGIPVGQLVGGQLVYETPGGMSGMSFPTGAIQSMGEGGQRVEEVVAAGDEDVEELQAAKSKLVMDFGLGQQAPERITIEVLKQLIRENPAKMSQAARIWMTRKAQESTEG
jgi:flagellar M-ring protein FliF